MPGEILIDSNVYIDLFRAGKDPIQHLYQWANRHHFDLSICGIIRVEVLRGIKSFRQRQALSDFMDVMICIRTDDKLWSDASVLAWNLDRRGKIIPATDAVIAACALRSGATILTSDQHFLEIENLETAPPPPDWFQPPP